MMKGWLKKEELIPTLADLGAPLIRRMVIAARRSPETFLEEAKGIPALPPQQVWKLQTVCQLLVVDY
jgi:hypothetical protein